MVVKWMQGGGWTSHQHTHTGTDDIFIDVGYSVIIPPFMGILRLHQLSSLAPPSHTRDRRENDSSSTFG